MGKVVNIIAKVNRAFTSSMEVGGIFYLILFFLMSIWCTLLGADGRDPTSEGTACCSFQVGILVNCEDLYTDRQWRVCHAFATFVARRTEAGKVGQTAKI